MKICCNIDWEYDDTFDGYYMAIFWQDSTSPLLFQ